ncbi:MAG: CDP-alcohol phosphatidyltransferase family protein [Polyangiales bacterium]
MSDLARWFPVARNLNLPCVFTLLNAGFGAVGVALAAQRCPRAALTCVALAIPCDIVDGWLARRRQQSSAFGAQLDSLADVISFVLLPAMIALSVDPSPRTALPAAAWVLAGVLRLARFAVVGTAGSGSDERFEGVPTAFAAAAFVTIFAVARWLPSTWGVGLVAAYLAALAPAMVSVLPFPKRGPIRAAMWILVPLAVVLAWRAP